MRAPCNMCLSLAFGAQLAWAAAPTGVKLDGTIGAPSALLPGPNYSITQNLGKLSGGNLFFSFQYFNVGTGETALFSTTSAGINNVISRVTGGYVSTIDGTIGLHAAYGAPNFFFINPSGVTFTANARLDLPAAVAITTADYLKFGDGNFYANPATQSTLSAAAPTAFGFLGATRASVNLLGANLESGAFGSADFQVAAGDVTIDGAGGQAGIFTNIGNIRLTAVGGASALVPLSGPFTSTDGTVTLRNDGSVSTLGVLNLQGGAVEVNAGNLLIDALGVGSGSGIFTASGATSNGGPITENVAGETAILNGGAIFAVAQGAGSTGEVRVQTGSLLIDGGSPAVSSGIFTAGFQGSSGSTGAVAVTVAGGASLSEGGQISSRTLGTANSGNLSFSAQALTIAGENSTFPTGLIADTFGVGNAGRIDLQLGSLSIAGGPSFTGISSDARPGSTGAAGDVVGTVAGTATLLNGAEIASSTFAAGHAGQVDLLLGSLLIDGNASRYLTGISSQTNVGASGSAGDVNVEVTGATTILDGGAMSSGSYGAGNAGQVSVQSGALTIDGGSTGAFTSISSSAYRGATGSAGEVNVAISGATNILDGGEITSSTFGPGNAGLVRFQSGSLGINRGTGDPSKLTGIASQSNAGATGSAGEVVVDVIGSAMILDGGAVSSSTYGGNAGLVSFQAGSLTLSGGSSDASTTVSSTAYRGATGAAGDVAVTVSGNASISDGGEISSDTFGPGNGGLVTFQSGSLSINKGYLSTFTGISSQTYRGATGAAGDVTVRVLGNASISSGGEISSDTFGPMDAGQVALQAGSLTIGFGNGTLLTGISSQADGGSSGKAGDVIVNVAGSASILDGGAVSSSTYSAGNAGRVTLQAGSLSVDGGNKTIFTGISSESTNATSGSAGDLAVTVKGGTSIIDGGEITSGTFSPGNAGRVTLQTGSLYINDGTDRELTGITSEAEPGSSGQAGGVAVNVADRAVLVDGGVISSDTFGAGKAGEVSLRSGELLIDAAQPSVFTGISSAAYFGSGGQPGRITVDTHLLELEGGGSITISNYATVPNPNLITPTQITINAQQIQLNDGLITADSLGNVAASAIDIAYVSAMRMEPGSVATSSYEGNGGPITISGDGPLLVSRSIIITSVFGVRNGNGGNIDIDVPQIVLDTGAIQANTSAPLASGGAVTINAQALVPSFQSFVLGGSAVFAVFFDSTALGANVVQAAAPDGISGKLNVTVPTLDLGTSLLGLTGRPAAPIPLGRSLCGFTRGSSLSVAGRGGVPTSAYDPLWLAADSAPRTASATEKIDLPAFFACQ